MAVFIASKSVRAVNYGGVIIKGGTGLTVANSLTTREGATITSVTDEDYQTLKNNHAFQKAEREGWVTVVSGDSESQSFKAMENLTSEADGSLPIQQSDLDVIADKQGESAGVALVLTEQNALTESQITEELVKKTQRTKAS